MIHKISVPRPEGRTPSEVFIGDALSEADRLLAGKRVVVITDPNLARLWPGLLENRPYVLTGLGEVRKTLSEVERLCRELLALGVDRGSYLVGIGGGIVTDITGFVASVYMRGVAGFGFIATSLLAQVDASVGGKNGVNLDGYKNIIGVFNQPDFVICDRSMLTTLPQRELRAGLAEAIKCGLVRNPELFSLFEGETFDSLAGNPGKLQRAVVGSVELKAAVVASDERERGDRKLLNLGHTFAHAIERCSSDYLHGEAVAIGLCIAARISRRLDMLSPEEVQRIEQVVENMGLPTRAPEAVPAQQLIAAIASDKKQEAGTIDFVLLEGIGRAMRREMLLTELDRITDGIL